MTDLNLKERLVSTAGILLVSSLLLNYILGDRNNKDKVVSLDNKEYLGQLYEKGIPKRIYFKFTSPPSHEDMPRPSILDTTALEYYLSEETTTNGIPDLKHYIRTRGHGAFRVDTASSEYEFRNKILKDLIDLYNKE